MTSPCRNSAYSGFSGSLFIYFPNKTRYFEASKKNNPLLNNPLLGPPGVLGIWGEWLISFRELGSTGNYFRGAREQAHNYGDIGSLAKKQKKKGKASILFDFFKKNSSASSPQDPLVNSKCIYFRTNMLIKIDLREKYGN